MRVTSYDRSHFEYWQNCTEMEDFLRALLRICFQNTWNIIIEKEEKAALTKTHISQG